MKIPKKLQSVLWSTNVDLLNQKKDKGYIIHQILIYGQIKDLEWLFNHYSKDEIINVFLHIPYKNYPRSIYFFVKNYILGLKDRRLDENLYVTSISGKVRPRATARLSKTQGFFS